MGEIDFGDARVVLVYDLAPLASRYKTENLIQNRLKHEALPRRTVGSRSVRETFSCALTAWSSVFASSS